MVKRVLTVAGSDSGGGAGIQADLKTFAALGVHGMSAITCITAQNTEAVTAIHQVPAEIVREQIRVVAYDIGVDAVKTGMLFSEEIIESVADELSGMKVPLVVDPVAVAKSGAPLLKPNAVEALVKRLLPLATVVTPNINEAKLLTNMDIDSIEEMEEAAHRIADMGPEAVVVKGGHLPSETTTDILLYAGNIYRFVADKIHTRNTHGTGCVFASAIAAYLAKGWKIPQAVQNAQKFVNEAIKRGLSIGHGYGPVNPTGAVYENSEKMVALRQLREAVEMIESEESFKRLIPESCSNIAVATEYASSVEDVVAIPGRIVRTPDGFTVVSEPWFGASKHVANAVLTAMKYDPSIRSAANIRFDDEILATLETLGFSVSFYDRSSEPEDVKKEEGRTIPWGVEEAVKKAGGVVDVVYHRGDVGKEPMAVVFGVDAFDVARKLIRISRRLSGVET
ncbi:MAG: bifunctional hydroxymethylpyrimidine kinase/phosphomethylpyrimidine kinase [Candidatus Caldarchaeum sp.]